jgi:predicted lipid carrier protein YhbT
MGAAFDLSGLDAAEVAKLVAGVPDEELRKALKGDARAAALDEIFRRFPEFVDRRRTRGVDAVIQWCISRNGRGAADRYVVELRNGHCRAGRDIEGEPSVSFELDAVDLLRLVTATASAQIMVVTGRMKVAGDPELAIRTAGFFKVAGGNGRVDVDPASVDAIELARAVRSARDDDLREALGGPLREVILSEVFRRFPEYLDPSAARGMDAAIKWKLGGRADGEHDRWVVELRKGKCVTGKQLDSEPKVTLVLGAAEFLKLVTGNANPTRMFLTGKLRVKGDLLFAASLPRIFRIPSPD